MSCIEKKEHICKSFPRCFGCNSYDNFVNKADVAEVKHKKYIEVESFKRELIDNRHFFPVIVKNALEKMPAADVVEVVRCRDCIYYDPGCCFNPQWDMESSPEVPMVRETDFCSYGERRSDNG